MVRHHTIPGYAAHLFFLATLNGTTSSLLSLSSRRLMASMCGRYTQIVPLGIGVKTRPTPTLPLQSPSLKISCEKIIILQGQSLRET
jgi:hypothetical protein